MNRSFKRRGILMTTALAIASLLLAGCSGGANTGGGATLDPNNPIKINVVRSAGGQFEPLMLGIEKGFYKDQGLDVSITAGTGNPATIAPQLVNGQVQIAMIDSASPIAAVSQGVPIKLISVIQNDDPGQAPWSGVTVS